MAESERRSRRPNGASSIYLGKDGKWHGRVTVGVKDDGSPDRRHVERKTEAECIKAVRALEKERDGGKVRKPGKRWTVAAWLDHWVENIAEPVVSVNTIAGYRVAVRVHLTPGLGAHRLDKLEPEHIERFYAKMRAQGSKPATVHQVHRTLRTALNEAVRRRHITENVVRLAKAPTLETEEVEPYTLEEISRLLEAATERRHPARRYLALALGLRQGEALGLKWSDVDFQNSNLRIRRSRLRRSTRTAAAAPAARSTEATARSACRSGRRPRAPSHVLARGRLACPLRSWPCWRGTETPRAPRGRGRGSSGRLRARTTGRSRHLGKPVNPRFDYEEWKRLLRYAKVRDGRLHDARHTAATVLLILGIPDTAVDGVMGWEPWGAMRRRYQHLTDSVLKNIADKVGRTLWGDPDEGDDGSAVPLVPAK